MRENLRGLPRKPRKRFRFPAFVFFLPFSCFYLLDFRGKKPLIFLFGDENHENVFAVFVFSHYLRKTVFFFSDTKTAKTFSFSFHFEERFRVFSFSSTFGILRFRFRFCSKTKRKTNTFSRFSFSLPAPDWRRVWVILWIEYTNRFAENTTELKKTSDQNCVA